jgi:hypothetical protein
VACSIRFAGGGRKIISPGGSFIIRRRKTRNSRSFAAHPDAEKAREREGGGRERCFKKLEEGNEPDY